MISFISSNIEKVYAKALIVSITLLAVYPAMAQQTGRDTSVITSTDRRFSATPLNLSGNPFYELINPEKSGFRPALLYSNNDRVYVGVHYNLVSKHWNPDSSGQRHKLYVRYSINQKAFSIGYQSIIHNAIGKWDLFPDVSYDWIKWMNFYGLGNETIQVTTDNNFYRIRSREAVVSFGLQRKIGRQSTFTIAPFYQRFSLIYDLDRFLSKSDISYNPKNFEPKNFGGVFANLQLQRLNNMLLPTYGFILSAAMGHVRNLDAPRSYTNYSAYTRLFLPLTNHVVLSVENGAAALTGQPEFYQMNTIGGNNLRGYRGGRFSGETMFHNNNELQYIFNINEKLYNGRVGLSAFFDQGRVWKRGEVSDKWHHGYGGGIMMAPFEKMYLAVQYGISNEGRRFHFDIRRSF